MENRAARMLVLLLTAGGLSLAMQAPAAGQATWTPTSLTGAPTPRAGHTAVWTGSRMIVWGGTDFSLVQGLRSGGLYEPMTDGWTATSTTGAPEERTGHAAVWTGSKMIVWGGIDPTPRTSLDTGGVYDPATDTWTQTSPTRAPIGRTGHTAVWTGSRMIVWGGTDSATQTHFDDGGIYDPATDTWAAMSRTGAPGAREHHTAVWTGSKMIVWGGSGEAGMLGTGGAYDPVTDTWAPVSSSGAPTARTGHTAVWTGSRMIAWGGRGSAGNTPGTGAIFDPSTGLWAPMTTTGAPTSRAGHTAVWARSRMVVWGGAEPGLPFSYATGGLYDPVADSWTATPTLNAPGQRAWHTSVWTSSRMIVWGGVKTETTHFYGSGGIYDDPGLLGPPADFYTVTPCRLADTRNAVGPTGGPALGAGSTRRLPVTGRACRIPSTAVAVSVNLTAVEATAAGHLTLYPGDALGPPLVSSIDFTPGVTRANNVIAPLATDGTGTIGAQNGSAGTVHFVLDVNGYFQPE